MNKFSAFFNEDLSPEPGTQRGSNPGGIHRDSSGERHYVKFYQNPEQGRAEVLTSRIHSAMGILGVGSKIQIVNGREGVVSHWNPHLKQRTPREWEEMSEKQAHQFGRIYHAAVLTRNWDVVGLGHSNILHHEVTENVHSHDHGGSFHFGALGGLKLGGYTDDIHEKENLLSSRRNPQSAHVFGHAFKKFPGARQTGLEAARNLDMDHVHHLFSTSGLEDWEKMHQTFVTRREKLLA